MQAVIMAGGKGTRLQSIAADTPKPMVKILGKPILEYQIENLKRSGIIDITLVVGYLGNRIQSYFGNGDKWGVSIRYIIEDQPLGTAGSLFFLKRQIEEDFFLLFGDLMLDVDWLRFFTFHKQKEASLTLFAHPNAHPFDSDLLIIDKMDRVIAIDEKGKSRDYYYHNLVNAGLYCISPEILDKVVRPEKMDLEKDLIIPAIAEGNVFAYISSEYVKDMGTPERCNALMADIKASYPSNKSLRHKQKCIFLDRDGTINKLNEFIKVPEQFELLPQVAEAIKKINQSPYLAIVATNQPVIARGECSFPGLDHIHMKMETELGAMGAYLDDIVFCPHHPDQGYVGEIPDLKFDCDCRKPKTGMLKKAAEKFNIDLENSWFIGDSTVDIQTGKNAGMRTVLLETGMAGRDKKYLVEADYTAKNLEEAVRLIIG